MSATTASLLRAGLYLQAMTVRNAVRQRLRRLRQPKYLVGAIVGGAYLYFVLFRRVFGGGGHAGVPWAALPPAESGVVLSLAALVLCVVVLLAWMFPGRRAALSFSEAEVAFLFPAPLTRRMLVHYKLLRSQFAIFLSAFVMSLLLRRGSMSGGGQAMHAAGWWLLFSTLNLHFVGASFARERLRELGVRGGWRVAVPALLSVAVAFASWRWLAAHVSLPDARDLDDGHALLAWIGTVLGAPPLSWLLQPFRWIAGPMTAMSAPAFWHALPAALTMLVLHYLWVVRSDQSFEEAALEGARRRAERVQAMRSGRSVLRAGPAKRRPAPFALSPTGFVPVAFLWKGLIALGPMYRVRNWLVAAALLAALMLWMGHAPERRPLLQVFSSVALGVVGWTLFFGPMILQRTLQRTLEHLDVIKSGPVAGWQLALGELLAPIAAMAAVQWLLLLVGALPFVLGDLRMPLPPASVASAALGLALLAPLLSGLMLCVPFAFLVLFPAWAGTMTARGGGIEVMGQRMLFFGAYVLVLALSLLPAAAAGAAAFLALRWLGPQWLALAGAAAAIAAVLALELYAAVRWLGRRIERIDISRELAR